MEKNKLLVVVSCCVIVWKVDASWLIDKRGRCSLRRQADRK